MRNNIGGSIGSLHLFRKRVVRAILDTLYDVAVEWPNEVERIEISRRIFKKFGLPNTVSYADGTLIPLAFKPEREDWFDFQGRKGGWSLSVLVVNDDKNQIRYWHAGWPGCTHDDRVYKNCCLAKSPDKYFSGFFARQQFL